MIQQWLGFSLLSMEINMCCWHWVR
jgi:hypothetical protein